MNVSCETTGTPLTVDIDAPHRPCVYCGHPATRSMCGYELGMKLIYVAREVTLWRLLRLFARYVVARMRCKRRWAQRKRQAA